MVPFAKVASSLASFVLAFGLAACSSGSGAPGSVNTSDATEQEDAPCTRVTAVACATPDCEAQVVHRRVPCQRRHL
jgi:hypothetical protein